MNEMTLASLFKMCADMGAGSVKLAGRDADGKIINLVLVVTEVELAEALYAFHDSWGEDDDQQEAQS